MVEEEEEEEEAQIRGKTKTKDRRRWKLNDPHYPLLSARCAGLNVVASRNREDARQSLWVEAV